MIKDLNMDQLQLLKIQNLILLLKTIHLIWFEINILMMLTKMVKDLKKEQLNLELPNLLDKLLL